MSGAQLGGSEKKRIEKLRRWKMLAILKSALRRALVARLQHHRDRAVISRSASFDGEWYLQNNSDVQVSGEDPLRHYLRIGAKEGRKPNAEFDTKWYIAQ